MKAIVSILFAAVLGACAAGPQQATGAGDSLVATEHWVPTASAVDGKPIKLYMREKHSRAANPSAFAGTRKVVVLAHGAGTPGTVAFDLQVEGGPGTTYSLMDYLAARGFDVFAVDYQNYGRSDQHPCGLCVTTKVAAEDLNATVDYVRKLRGVDKVHVLGWSWGTTVSGLFATQHPQKVDRLVMYAPPVWSEPRGQAPTAEFRNVTPDNSRGLFEAPASDAAAVDAWVKAVERWAPKAPNGVLLDLNTKMPITDPRRISVPTMIIIGDLDRATPINQANLPGYFAALPNTDKQLIIIPGAGHALTVQKPRLRFYNEVAKWFSE